MQLSRTVEFSPAVLYTLKFGERGATPVYVSENITRVLGVSAADTNAKWWTESLHPEDRDRVMAILSGVTKGQRYSMEYRIRHKSGAYIWVHDSSRVIRNRSGLPTELTGVWMDITERKQADERLKESEAKFRSLVEQALFGIYIIQANRLLGMHFTQLTTRGCGR